LLPLPAVNTVPGVTENYLARHYTVSVHYVWVGYRSTRVLEFVAIFEIQRGRDCSLGLNVGGEINSDTPGGTGSISLTDVELCIPSSLVCIV
jgi:hypothetical protein